MVSVSEPSPSGTLFQHFHYGTLSGAKNAGNRVENPGIQEIRTGNEIITEEAEYR